jgi:beta-amylase
MFLLSLSALSLCSSDVFVMAPLDIFNSDGSLAYPDKLNSWLSQLSSGSVDGLMIDVWWGLTEPIESSYRWSGYQSLFGMCAANRLRIVPVLSFHRCGGNVGDTTTIPLPTFVLSAQAQPFFVNQNGQIDTEYISFAFDGTAVSGDGRTPIQMYGDLARSFYGQFRDYFDNGSIAEVEVGMGPCGELRFPSYQISTGWVYPGCGDFQSFDSLFAKKLAADATAAGVPEYGKTPVVDQNAVPGSDNFWRDGADGAWDSAYGKWFIAWYAGEVTAHADRVLSAIRNVFGNEVKLSGKIPGLHWWYLNDCHCTENAAGLRNAWDYDGYRDILTVFEEHGTDVCFTCLEMTPDPGAGSNPGWLVQQIIDDAAWAKLRFEGENALECYDSDSYGRILGWVSKGLVRFTYLRLGDTLMQPSNWDTFVQFVRNMHSA